MRIHVLPDSLVNLIAAGEVVERPASVVKELVENAIDAGASKIEVGIRGGGIKEISVQDNGHGMYQEELALAFTRHATSKIAEEIDLYNIRSLGFRGEALPSIAAVSKVDVWTAAAEGLGSRMVIEGGQVVEVGPWACPVGTRVRVSDIFFNTPARRKFLKSQATEANHIYEAVIRLALSRPEISFSLYNEGRQVFKTPGNGRLEDAVAAVYGIDYLEKMVRVEDTGGEVGLWGLVSRPDFVRSSRRDQVFIVNRRVVRSPLLFRALDEAYRGLLLSKEFPAAVLFVQVAANSVDVNVHPQKTEVKFADERKVFEAVRQAVRLSLTTTPGVSAGFPLGRSQTLGSGEPRAVKPALNYPEPTRTAVWTEYLISPSESDWVSEPVNDTKQTAACGFNILGQWLDTYIVVATGEELWLVDQHAAHERVLYERLQKDNGPGDVQQLVMPVSFSLPATKIEALERYGEALREYGFDIDVMGRNAAVIRSAPSSVLGREAETVERLIDILAAGWEGNGLPRETIWAVLACKGAIKAGTPLSSQEMSWLIREWLSCRDYHHCPHGRPIFTAVSVKEVEKKLKRI